MQSSLDRQIATMRGELAQIDAEARLHEQRLALAGKALRPCQKTSTPAATPT